MSKAARRKKLFDLIRKYMDGAASEREKAFVNKYYEYFERKDAVSASFSDEEKQEIESRLLKNIHAGMRKAEYKPVISFYRNMYVRVAAAVILLLAVGIISYLYNRHPAPSKQRIAVEHDIQAGTNGAILKLAGGKKIVLDSAQSGQIIYNAGNIISKTDSAVSFAVTQHSRATEHEYNELITPRARQEQLILADGTKVWLNAASSIRFPTNFSGKQRVVEITGEAYFEVAKDISHPFIVKVGDMQVKVLGTHFNIMAYTNEQSLQTTLLEGAVKVTQLSTHRTELIKPGEQVKINSKNGDMRLIPNANIRLAVAWKNGMQAFSNADITTIMREVERWYDVDVVYQGQIPKRVFSGEIPRSASLAELLKLFEANKMHFIIDASQRRLTLLP